MRTKHINRDQRYNKTTETLLETSCVKLCPASIYISIHHRAVIRLGPDPVIRPV